MHIARVISDNVCPVLNMSKEIDPADSARPLDPLPGDWPARLPAERR